MDIPIDLEKDVEYIGNTEEEKRLNKELLSTILELNAYQDAYDNMMEVEEIKDRINEYKKEMEDPNLPPEIAFEYDIRIQELEWVLNGSETREEKLSKLPKVSKEDFVNMIKEFNEKYKQLSLEDYGIDLGGKKDE